MTLTITQESPVSSEAQALVDGSEAAIRAVLSADECFTFTAQELDHPGIRFYMARRDSSPVGCVALCDYGNYGEVKRLFVTPDARGTGIARELMRHVEAQASIENCTIIRLETALVLTDGVALYRSMGYKERGPFGNYRAHPASYFMEKSL